MEQPEFIDWRGVVQMGLARTKPSVHRLTRQGLLPPPIRWAGRNIWRVDAVRKHLASLEKRG